MILEYHIKQYGSSSEMSELHSSPEWTSSTIGTFLLVIGLVFVGLQPIGLSKSTQI